MKVKRKGESVKRGNSGKGSKRGVKIREILVGRIRGNRRRGNKENDKSV